MALIIFKIMICLIISIALTLFVYFFISLFDLEYQTIITLLTFIIIFITILSGTFAGIF